MGRFVALPVGGPKPAAENTHPHSPITATVGCTTRTAAKNAHHHRTTTASVPVSDTLVVHEASVCLYSLSTMRLSFHSAFASFLAVAFAGPSLGLNLLKQTEGSLRIVGASEQQHGALSLSSVSDDGFTTLVHAAFPKHSVRITRVRDFCDTSVKYVAALF